MFFECLPTGKFGSNCYIVGENGEGVIIDCGVKCPEVEEVIKNTNLKIKYIILTHGHLDHIWFVDEVRKSTGAEVLIHQDDADALTNALINGSVMFTNSFTVGSADRLLKDGDRMEAGGLQFEIIHTPGHTPGGICIKVNNCVFTGDTLFKLSIGRTDLGYGNQTDLLNSIRNKLFSLNEDMIVYPGHGESTTIGFEKRNNLYAHV